MTPVPCVDVFRLESVVLDLQPGSKSEILEALVGHAITSKALPRGRRDQVLEVLIEREQHGSTAFGRGIAVPHARIPGLRATAGLVARSVDGLDFRSVDGEPVHVFIMLVSPESRAEEHLATLRWISQMARDPDFLSFIKQARNAEQVLDVLQERAP